MADSPDNSRRKPKPGQAGFHLLAATVVGAWLVFGLIGLYLGMFAALELRLSVPLELRLRSQLQKTPDLDERLKIFSFDNTTYASLRRPTLSTDQWAKIIHKIAIARPRAIVTTHMFGGEEFSDSDALHTAIAEARRDGITVVAGFFAYPDRISFRSPLTGSQLGANFLTEAQAQSIPALSRAGQQLYGPPPEAAAAFTHLGHEDYAGDWHVALFERLGPKQLVPHIALAVAQDVKGTGRNLQVDGFAVHLDTRGRVPVNLASLEDLAERTKNLPSLLNNAESKFRSPYVKQGDVVLLLLDMYVGKVNFVATPQGLTPAGYIVASVLNSVLSGNWLRELELGPGLIALTIVAAAVVGLTTNGLLLGLLFIFGAAALVLTGLGSFIYAGMATPWLSCLGLYIGVAASCHLAKVRNKLLTARAQHFATDKETARLQAIVRTAQMFAHDVRQPFRLLGTAVRELSAASPPGQLAATLQSLGPELDRSMATVETMIKDVMSMNGEVELELTQASLAEILDAAIRESLLAHPTPQLQVARDYNYPGLVTVDQLRIGRVFVNILGSALPAMHSGGRLWLELSSNVRDGREYCQICIGHSGKVIAPDMLPHVFEAFFTTDHSSGPGLGLAIAERIVKAHGGSIWCDSSPGKGTEYFVLLPAAAVAPAGKPAAVAS